MAKINKEKHKEIYERYMRREKQKDIAQEFGVSTMAVCKIIKKYKEELIKQGD